MKLATKYKCIKFKSVHLLLSIIEIYDNIHLAASYHFIFIIIMVSNNKHQHHVITCTLFSKSSYLASGLSCINSMTICNQEKKSLLSCNNLFSIFISVSFCGFTTPHPYPMRALLALESRLYASDSS